MFYVLLIFVMVFYESSKKKLNISLKNSTNMFGLRLISSKFLFVVELSPIMTFLSIEPDFGTLYRINLFVFWSVHMHNIINEPGIPSPQLSFYY